MKKKVIAISLAAVMLLCGSCAVVNTSDTQSGFTSAAHETAAAATAAPSPTPAPSFNIPRETKVFATPEELKPVKPLFESYLLGNDMLAFAVSAVFNGEAYLMGFIYENDEWELPFNCVIGLKDNGGTFKEVFISDKYDNPKGLVPENFTFLEWDETFYDTQAFEYNGMTVVLTKEALNEDEAMNNVFVINDKGILFNYVCGYSCRPFIFEDELFIYEDYGWSELAVQNNEVVLNEVTDYTTYIPEIKDGDIVITLESCMPGTYDEETKSFSDDNNIELYINDSGKLALEDFDFEGVYDDEYGQFYKEYYSKTEFNVNKGSNIMILYRPGTKASCYIYGSNIEDYRLPGVTILKASEAVEYVAVIYTDCEYYNIRIIAE